MAKLQLKFRNQTFLYCATQPPVLVTQHEGAFTQPHGVLTQHEGHMTQPRGALTQPPVHVTQREGALTQPPVHMTKREVRLTQHEGRPLKNYPNFNRIKIQSQIS